MDGELYASIGPRLLSRGKESFSYQVMHGKTCFNWAAASQPRKAHNPYILQLLALASIGPRLLSRGKLGCVHREGFHLGALQLGRGFSAAESSMSSTRTTCSRMLQLGRGFSAAERRWLHRQTMTSWCFNWAAASQPRKDDIVAVWALD